MWSGQDRSQTKRSVLVLVLRRSPDPLVGCGRGHPLPTGLPGLPHNAFGASALVYHLQTPSAVADTVISVEKKSGVDPFAELREGASCSSAQSATAARLSGRDELARYEALQVPTAGRPVKFWSDLSSYVAGCTSYFSAQSERDGD